MAGITSNDSAAVAFSALYDRHGAQAFAVAYRIVGIPEAAEEVVQDAFLTIWRRADQYAPARGEVRTWLLTIVRNRAIDQLRSRQSGPRVAATIEDVGATLAAPDDTSTSALRELDAKVVRAAVAGLPALQREVVTLAYFDGLSYPEVAARTGAPLGTVKSRMYLALTRLRGALVSDQVRG